MDSWSPPSEVVESTSGLAESTSGLLESTNGLAESTNGLMESTHGLYECELTISGDLGMLRAHPPAAKPP
jgi:hypothetical protein